MSNEIPLIRCGWADANTFERDYHDNEWGVPVHDDNKLFELLILEGKQAGLSWSTILKKRDTISEAFDYFNAEKIVKYDQNKINELLNNEGIIRNKLKVNAVIANAKAYLALVDEYGTFDSFLWKYVNYEPIRNVWTEISDVPASTELSALISKDLKKLGFKFVGPTTIYAYMQAIGMVNDHLVKCFRHSMLN
ncbi:DNA-3-methyladenine glycosylase I [Sporosarcina sp. ANT_H38]|uniref:DNA-3-methyladenine glycosylase I n=1 Tax=Sporosarcina sp. ANT_H38 TaxID=2597358 RepID=UPI0011F23153|nr:DNA-3-methyladenine glycosylase I [Sporosarcina sp. ANT_H38]KAA0964818.1 DNA-3-methyladenine glycosylase I [Sporosarcina sp. ANT_H38]